MKNILITFCILLNLPDVFGQISSNSPTTPNLNSNTLNNERIINNHPNDRPNTDTIVVEREDPNFNSSTPPARNRRGARDFNSIRNPRGTYGTGGANGTARPSGTNGTNGTGGSSPIIP